MKNTNIIHNRSWGWGTHTKVGFRAYIGRTEMGIYGWIHGKGMTDAVIKGRNGEWECIKSITGKVQSPLWFYKYCKLPLQLLQRVSFCSTEFHHKNMLCVAGCCCCNIAMNLQHHNHCKFAIYVSRH